MTYIIATTNMKGGVGKTTLTVNLATCLVSAHKKRVLVVDVDSQISATLSLLSPKEFAQRRREKRTLKYLLKQVIQPIHPKASLATASAIRPYCCHLKGLDLLPGDLDLYDDYMVSQVLHQRAQGDVTPSFAASWNELERRLMRDILQPVLKDYDFIILDCAPGYNILTRSSLAASHFYILPTRPDPLSIAGIQLLERRVRQLRESHEAEVQLPVQLLGIVFSMSNHPLLNRYGRQVMQRVHETYSDEQIFKVKIPNDINVSKAVDSFKPVTLLNPQAVGARAFLQLTQEFLQKLKLMTGLKEQTSRMSLVHID
ncbi:MAG: ParA family protein [Cyanobacteria bacterium P01_H01_bin.121]